MFVGCPLNTICTGVIGAEKLIINRRELERRLGLPVGELGKDCEYDEALARCEKVLIKEANIRYAFIRLKAEVKCDNNCDFGMFSVDSTDLAKNLMRCSEVVLMGVTLGAGVDRLLKRLSLTSKSDHFLTDALASALVDAAADRLEEIAKTSVDDSGACSFRPRYSPGYGDCSIENQKTLLSALEGEKNLGISLNDRYFMSPSKSITAIMGLCI